MTKIRLSAAEQSDRGFGLGFHSLGKENHMIYLDYSANTPVDSRVLSRFCEIEQNFIGNANSTHEAGRNAAQELAFVTDAIADLLGVNPAEIIFTSGASESNNLAIKGSLLHSAKFTGKHVITTQLEHSSVSACLTELQNHGYQIDIVELERDGKVNLDHLKALLTKETALVAICAVDSELGTVQPIAQIAEIVKDYPACRFHVDATQAVGKTELVLNGVDTMSIAPHKFYGLNGSGLLFKRRNVELYPLIHGGASVTSYRSGTPTLALDAALETALRLALENSAERISIVRKHNRDLRSALSAYPNVVINSPKNAVPHILNLSVRDVKGSVFQRSLNEFGVCVSVKSACSTDGQPSKAVFALCHDRRTALSSWRISLSHLTTEQEIKEFIRIFDQCYKKLVV